MNNKSPQETKEDAPQENKPRYVEAFVDVISRMGRNIQRVRHKLGFVDLKATVPHELLDHLSYKYPSDFDVIKDMDGIQVQVTYSLPIEQPVNPKVLSDSDGKKLFDIDALLMFEKEKYAQQVAKQRAIAFGQWVAHNDWVYLRSKNKWINEDQEELQQYLTDEQLYDLFNQSIQDK